MLTERRSLDKHFIEWRKVIVDKKEVTVRELSKLSGCSEWTIDKWKVDFCKETENITFKNRKFIFQTKPEPLAQTLSTLSKNDLEDLR